MNKDKEELLCTVPYCRNIPIVKINNDSSITINCNIHPNNHNTYKIEDYLKKINELKLSIERCSDCKKVFNQNNYIFYCEDCNKLIDNFCFMRSRCYIKDSHKVTKTTFPKFIDKMLCLKDKKTYLKYCQICENSLCISCKKNCEHDLIDIQPKSLKELDEIEKKLNTQEATFKKLQKIVNDCLKEFEDKLKMEKLIYKSYLNNKLNGNSIANLNNLKFSINQKYKNKIDLLYDKKGNIEDKLLCLYYYYLMYENEVDNDEVENRINNLKRDLIGVRQINSNKIGNNKVNNIIKKEYKFDDNYDFNINNSNIGSPINKNNQKSKESYNQNDNKNINVNKNINQKDINRNSIINTDKNIHKLLRGPSLNSIIDTISEKSKILSLIRLDSGNLALGFLNGFIKIYNCDSICKEKNKNNDQINPNPEKHLLLEINQFKGRRINYIYQLKDKTLLCCSYSRIHHINLVNNDTDYLFLGTIKLSTHELPKKIIELGNDLIVSLSERNIKKANVSKNICILKIFNKILSQNQKENENFSNIFSDNDSINSASSSLSLGWENVYSNEDESPLSSKDEILMEDRTIKIYKRNKNLDNIHICSIFGTKIDKSQENNILYEFIATSNKIYSGGENCILFYSVMKNPMRHGCLFFISKELNDSKLSCSKEPESICLLNKKFIIVALQKNNENNSNGIALIDINDKKLVRIYKGYSVGFISKSIRNKFIIFSTNKNKDTTKNDQIRLIKDLGANNQNNSLNIVCSIQTHFSGITELKSKNNLLFFAISSNKELYIISLLNK